MTAVEGSTTTRELWLSRLLGNWVTAQDGQRLGKVTDAIVRLDLQPDRHPALTGVVVTVGRRDLFVPISVIVDLASEPVTLSTARLDLRAFERREGEILLKRDLLGHRLIDVAGTRLVTARDVELAERDGGWLLVGIEVSTGGRLGRLVARGQQRVCRDWSDFEPLIGHDATAKLRAPFSRLRRLRPAEIADLVEEATRDESEEILEALGDDKELEADVFEELEPDRQVHVLRDRSDAEVADVLSHMRPDDAADVLVELPQERRLPVLELLPTAIRTKIRSLLGYNPETAGGLMTPDVLVFGPRTAAADAIAAIRAATTIANEALLSVYVVESERLLAALSLPALLHAEPGAALGDVADPDPVRVTPDAHIIEVAVRMTDFNLCNLPVVDQDDRLLGAITVDDVLRATVPEEWWDRVEDVEGAVRGVRRDEAATG